MNLTEAFEELNKLYENLVKPISDKDFFDKLEKTVIENDRFDKGQFEKLAGNGGTFYALINDKDEMLAAAYLVKNKLNLNDLYINEVQTFKKGAGKELLQELFKNNANLWLMAEPGNSGLKTYYDKFGLNEFMLPKADCCYDVDTYFYYNINDKASFEKAIRNEYKKEDE